MPCLHAARDKDLQDIPLKRRLLVAVGALLLLAVGGLEAWTRRPVGPPSPALEVPAGTSTLVLVTHGSADADDPLLADIVAGLDQRYRAIPGAAVRFLRWAPESDERLRAAATAVATGRRLGERLAAHASLRDLTLIAHSSGTFLPDAICESLRAAGRNDLRVTMVLLDPFQIRGFVDWTWGAREHGRCADFALAVINTDDPAPATNRPLDRAYNLDVTGLPGSAGFLPNGHYWPLRYYRDHLLGRQPEIAGWSHEEKPRGTVQRASARP